MKIILKTGAFAALTLAAACGSETSTGSGGNAAAGANGAPASSATEAAQSHQGTGTIKSISGSDVTIAHEAIPTIGWPAMQMTFKATNGALLEGVKPGDRVAFAFSKAGSDYALTSLSRH